MKKGLFVLWMAFSFGLSAQNIRSGFQKLETKIAKAVVASDLNFLNKIYSQDFVFTHSTGKVQNKKEWLENVKKGNFRKRKIHIKNVKNYNDTVAVLGRLNVKTKRKKKYWIEYLRVYKKKGITWEMISHKSLDGSY